MRKLAITGLLVVIVAAFLLLRWHWQHVARFDSDFRQHLVGVWLRQEANLRCTRTVAPDRSFVELSWLSHPDRTNSYQRTGTLLVSNGHLIEMIKAVPTRLREPLTLAPRGLFIRIHANLPCAGRILLRRFGKELSNDA